MNDEVYHTFYHIVQFVLAIDCVQVDRILVGVIEISHRLREVKRNRLRLLVVLLRICCKIRKGDLAVVVFIGVGIFFLVLLAAVFPATGALKGVWAAEQGKWIWGEVGVWQSAVIFAVIEVLVGIVFLLFSGRHDS